jgi:hypothetical protein
LQIEEKKQMDYIIEDLTKEEAVYAVYRYYDYHDILGRKLEKNT